MILSNLTTVSGDSWAVYSPENKIGNDDKVMIMLSYHCGLKLVWDLSRQAEYHNSLVNEGNTIVEMER